MERRQLFVKGERNDKRESDQISGLEPLIVNEGDLDQRTADLVLEFRDESAFDRIVNDCMSE